MKTNRLAYLIEEIDNAFDDDITYYETILYAWKKVKRNRTKSGDDFKQFGRNFSGCTIVADYMRGNRIEVYGFDKHGKRVTDYISNTENATPETTPERVIKEPYLVAYYYKTIDEIFVDIDKTIRAYESRIESYKRQREKAEKIAAEYYNRFTENLDKLAEDCGGRNTSLFFKISQRITGATV